MSHVSAEYRGFSVCEKCDIILCPLNSLGECKGKPVGGAREYIDRLKSRGLPAPDPRDAEIERLRLALGESEGVRKALEESELVKAHRVLVLERDLISRERDRAEAVLRGVK